MAVYKIKMVGNVIIEKALLIIRIFRTPRDKVSNPVFGAIIIAHQGKY
jgi:hypothetical protein